MHVLLFFALSCSHLTVFVVNGQGMIFYVCMDFVQS